MVSDPFWSTFYAMERDDHGDAVELVHHVGGTFRGTYSEFMARLDWSAWLEATYVDPAELPDPVPPEVGNECVD